MATLTSRILKAGRSAVETFRASAGPSRGDGAEGLTVARTPPNPRKSAGVSATPAYGGFVVGRETNPDLFGTKKYGYYHNLLQKTAIVAASVRYYLNLIARPGWEFDPAPNAKNKDEARKYAEWTDEAIRGHLEDTWHGFVRRAACYRTHGFSTQEWLGRPMKCSFGEAFALTGLQLREQRTISQWDVDRQGVVAGVVQQSPHDGSFKYVPRTKLVYCVDNPFSDDPSGFGLLRQAVTPAHYLDRYEQLEAFGYETDLRGTPIIRAPLAYMRKAVADGDMTPDEVEKIMSPFYSILENHVRSPELGLLLDSMVYYGEGDNASPSQSPMFDFETVTGEVTAKAQQAVALAIERKLWDIARIFGTETLLLGANGKGTYALSDDKTQSLLMMIDGVLLDVAAQVKMDLIRPLFLINQWPLEYLSLIHI